MPSQVLSFISPFLGLCSPAKWDLLVYSIHAKDSPTLACHLCTRILTFKGQLSLLMFCKWHCLYQYFFRFPIYGLIYDVCFSLSDLLHSVWQLLGPSTSVQMTQFCSFLWLGNTGLWEQMSGYQGGKAGRWAERLGLTCIHCYIQKR